MSEENRRTLEVYEKKAKDFLGTTLKHYNLNPEKADKKEERLRNFLKNSFEVLPKGSKVFEIGCSDGQSSKYLESLGYDVLASDVAKDFVEIASKNGLKTIKFNLLEDDFKEKYSGILAWRVFVHFTEDDCIKALNKIYQALNEGGIFVFNLMNREIREVDHEWVDFQNEYYLGVERYFNYFSEEFMNKVINDTNFKIVRFFKEGGENNNKWLVYVLQK